MIGRIAGELHAHLMEGGKFDQPLQPLGALSAVFWTVVGVDDEGMWRMTVFLSVGQISDKRSTMKSAVAWPVVKVNQVSAVSGRWIPKGVSLASGSRS